MANMKKYLVLIRTESDTVQVLKIDANNFADAEAQVRIYPLLKEIIQISLYS